MTDISLTRGFFQSFLEGSAPSTLKPVLQICENRLMAGDKARGGSGPGYRLRMSDGTFTYSSCVTAVNLTERFQTDKLDKDHCIVRVLSWMKTTTTGKPCFAINDYEFVKSLPAIVGNPQAHTGKTQDYAGIQNMHLSSPVGSKRSTSTEMAADRHQEPTAKRAQLTGPKPSITAISLITPYINRFRICGIVTDKDKDIKNLSNARGTFRLFGFTITDNQQSSLRVTAFAEQADKFFPIIENDRVYYISGSGKQSIRAANKRFNTTGHDYELTLPRDTEVEICDEHIKQPELKLRQTPLNQLAHLNGEAVDVLAVIDKVEDITTVISRATQKELQKRDVHLIDKTATDVCLTLWGEQATAINATHVGEVIGIKGAQVKEFRGGIFLSSPFNASDMNFNVPGKETNELYTWHRETRPNAEIKSLSTIAGGGGVENDMRLIGMATQNNFCAANPRGVYFCIRGMISQIRTENTSYKSCPKEGCKKKVTEQGGEYRCEKCNEGFPSYRAVAMIRFEVTDFTGSVWLSAFDDKAEKLLGVKAAHMVQLKEEDPIAYEALFDKARFVDFCFNVRMHEREYNGNSEPAWELRDVRPLTPEVHKRILTNCIKALQSI